MDTYKIFDFIENNSNSFLMEQANVGLDSIYILVPAQPKIFNRAIALGYHKCEKQPIKNHYLMERHKGVHHLSELGILIVGDKYYIDIEMN